MKRFIHRTLVLILVLSTLAVAGLFAGPLVSGGLFLSWHGRFEPVDHDLPASFRPLHRGHIDTSTGLYVREDEDIVLPGTPPFVLRRTYRTEDRASRAFGIGASHNGEWYLYGDGQQFQWVELILADGSRIHYDRTSSGTSFWNALYRHWQTSGEFYGSRLAWNGREWLIREYDGSLGRFLPCGPGGSRCAIVEWRDADGHYTRFNRDAKQRLLSIEAGSQRMTFEYDDKGRVSRIEDGAKHSIAYSYDRLGRLTTAKGSDGVVRRYDYDDQDRLTRIEEPGRVLENGYDSEGLCIRQRARFTENGSSPDWQYTFDATYRTVDGRVVQTDIVESDSPPVRYVFTTKGLPASETYEPDSDKAVVLKYDRDTLTNRLTGLSVTCGSGRWRLLRTLPIPDEGVSVPRTQLLRECGIDQ